MYVTIPSNLVAAQRSGTIGEAAAYLQAIGHAGSAAALRHYAAQYAEDAERGPAAMTPCQVIDLPTPRSAQ